MSQGAILDFLKNHPDTWFTLHQISESIERSYSTTMKALNKISKKLESQHVQGRNQTLWKWRKK